MSYAISEHNFRMLLKLPVIPHYLCTMNSIAHVDLPSVTVHSEYYIPHTPGCW